MASTYFSFLNALISKAKLYEDEFELKCVNAMILINGYYYNKANFDSWIINIFNIHLIFSISICAVNWDWATISGDISNLLLIHIQLQYNIDNIFLSIENNELSIILFSSFTVTL